MNQHLDTIPVWDAYKQQCECPMCVIFKKNEDDYVDNFLGASYMEPSRREETNEKGFCRKHFKMMYDKDNRLGVALMTDTYMRETIKKLKENAQRLIAAADGEAKKNIFMRIGRKNADIQSAAAEVSELASRCIMCEKINHVMDRYIYTMLYMWKHEIDFRMAFATSKGMCLDHYAQTLAMAQKLLSGSELSEFIQTLTNIQIENLERVEGELEWFTLKADHRNKDKPWGNSRDAVERGVNKMRGGAL